MASPKDSVLAALAGSVAARPTFAIMGGGVWWAHLKGLTLKEQASNPQLMAENLAQMAKETQSAIVYVGTGYPNVLAAALGGGLEFRPLGAPELARPFLFTEEDLARLDVAMADDHWLLNALKQALRITRQMIGGHRLVTMTAWGPFTLCGRAMGEERWLKCLHKNPPLAHHMLDFMTRYLIHVFEPIVAAGDLEVIMLGEPSASGDMISRKHFKEFAVAYAAIFSAWARGAGAEVMIHVCGNTADRLDLFLQTGARIVSLDGKVEMARMKEAFAGKIAYAGNLDPIGALLKGTVDEVLEASRNVLKTAGPGLILMPGCDLPPGVPLENIRAMAQAAADWK